MITALLATLGGLTGIFGIFYVKDVVKNKDTFSNVGWGKLLGVGLITDFFDTLGIGSFSPTTAMYKLGNMVNDKLLPGTLNVGHTLPVVLEAFAFITVVDVDPLTLVLMIAAATVGAVIAAGVVTKLPLKQIRVAMGVALIAVAFVMFAGQVGWMPSGGEALGLTGAKLAIGVIGNFILGGLMTIGIGLYAPCMALVYALGMSPAVAFPIMMGSCAMLMPAAGMKFVKEGAYDRKASVALSIGGAVGVFIAVYLVTSLPLNVLKWLVIGVITYTGIVMLRSAMVDDKKAKAEAKEVRV